MTAGQRHDVTQAISLIEGLEFERLLADKGYDSDELRDFVIGKDAEPDIPSRNSRTEERPYDEDIYKERHKIENTLGFLKHYRRIFARFDKLKRNFTAFLHFVAALQWLK